MARDVLIPDPMLNSGDYLRFHHLDIPDLDKMDLTDELNYLRPHLWGLEVGHWLRERVANLELELRRRGDTGREFSEQRPQKSTKAEGIEL